MHRMKRAISIALGICMILSMLSSGLADSELNAESGIEPTNLQVFVQEKEDTDSNADAGAEDSANGDADADDDTEINSNGNADAGAEDTVNGNADADDDTGADSDGNADADVEEAVNGEADADSDTDAGSNGNANAGAEDTVNGEADADSDTEADSNGNADAGVEDAANGDADADDDTEINSNGNTDAGAEETVNSEADADNDAEVDSSGNTDVGAEETVNGEADADDDTGADSDGNADAEDTANDSVKAGEDINPSADLLLAMNQAADDEGWGDVPVICDHVVNDNCICTKCENAVHTPSEEPEIRYENGWVLWNDYDEEFYADENVHTVRYQMYSFYPCQNCGVQTGEAELIGTVDKREEHIWELWYEDMYKRNYDCACGEEKMEYAEDESACDHSEIVLDEWETERIASRTEGDRHISTYQDTRRYRCEKCNKEMPEEISTYEEEHVPDISSRTIVKLVSESHENGKHVEFYNDVTGNWCGECDRFVDETEITRIYSTESVLEKTVSQVLDSTIEPAISPEGHTYTYNVIETLYCHECDEAVSETVVDTAEISEAHTNASTAGTCCDVCGYEMNCSHANTERCIYDESDTACSWIDAETHSIKGRAGYRDYCTDCGMWVAEGQTEYAFINRTENHILEKGKCRKCGYFDFDAEELPPTFEDYPDPDCEHEWDDGYYCFKCGTHRHETENDCPTSEYRNAVYTPVDEGLHEVSGDYLILKACNWCDAEEIEYRETRTELLRHHFVDIESDYQICRDCGYKMKKEEDAGFFDDCWHNGHEYENCICTKCGDEDHSYESDESCVCSECGKTVHDVDDYICECGRCGAEIHTVSEKTGTAVVNKSYTEADATYHNVTGTLVSGSVCEKCGKLFEQTAEVGVVEYQEEHDDYDSCPSCGYVDVDAEDCSHSATVKELCEKYVGLTQRTSTTHSICYEVYEQEVCTLCGEILSKEFIETITVAEPHSNLSNFGAKGPDVWGCEVCNYEPTCRHPNPVKRIVRGWDYSPIPPVYERIDSEKHMVKGEIQLGDYCPDCNFWDDIEDFEEYEYSYREFEEEHSMVDGSCEYCGYEEPKATATPAPTATTTPTAKPDADPTMPVVSDEPLTTASPAPSAVPTMPTVSDTPAATERPTQSPTDQPIVAPTDAVTDPCSHENMQTYRVVGEREQNATCVPIDEEFHEVYLEVHLRHECLDCDYEESQLLFVDGEQVIERQKEEHSYENGNCKFCGVIEPCMHGSTYVGEEYEFIAYKPFNAQEHQRIWKFREVLICEDCGDKKYTGGERPASLGEAHFFSDDVCVDCEYTRNISEEECRHSFYSYEFIGDSEEYEPIDSDTHRVSGEIREIANCRWCDLGYSISVGMGSLVEKHFFLNKTCADCGYRMVNTSGYVSVPDMLNVRSGPSTSHDVIGKLPRGAEVKICGKSYTAENVWYLIEYADEYGYVSGQYITFEKNTAEEPDADIVEINPTEEPGAATANYALSLNASHASTGWTAESVPLDVSASFAPEAGVYSMRFYISEELSAMAYADENGNASATIMIPQNGEYTVHLQYIIDDVAYIDSKTVTVNISNIDITPPSIKFIEDGDGFVAIEYNDAESGINYEHEDSFYIIGENRRWSDDIIMNSKWNPAVLNRLNRDGEMPVIDTSIVLVQIRDNAGNVAHDIYSGQGEIVWPDETPETDEELYGYILNKLPDDSNPLEDPIIERILTEQIEEVCPDGVDEIIRRLKAAPETFRNIYVYSFFEYNRKSTRENSGQPQYDSNKDCLYSPDTRPDVLFHETGHAVDANASPTSGMSTFGATCSELYTALQTDLVNYITATMREVSSIKGSPQLSDTELSKICDYIIGEENAPYPGDEGEVIDPIPEGLSELEKTYYILIRDNISEDLRNCNVDAARMVNDIFGGLSNNTLRGDSSEGMHNYPLTDDTDYWFKDGEPTNMVCVEAWAEYFAAFMVCDVEAIEENRKFFPNGCAVLDKIAKQMCEYYMSLY